MTSRSPVVIFLMSLLIATCSFAATGKMGPSLGAAEVRSLSLAPKGEVIVAARLAVRIGSKDLRSFQVPGDRQGAVEPLEKIEAAVVTPGVDLTVEAGQSCAVVGSTATATIVSR